MLNAFPSDFQTLDVILSHLDLESWKKARLVCRTWNDRALANFSKNRTTVCGTFVVVEDEDDSSSDEEEFRLPVFSGSGLSPRMMSSLYLRQSSSVGHSQRLEAVQNLFGQLRLTENLEG